MTSCKVCSGTNQEPGYLVQDGIATDILASVMEPIKKEKGDSFLNEIKSNSNLKFEDFRPHHLKRSKLGAFM
jgi:translation initiation factor 4G